MRDVTYDQAGDDRRSGDRRRCRGRVFRDQRSGFDRRAARAEAGVVQNALIGLRDRPAALVLLLAAVNVFNVADFSLTLNVLAAGGGEANPVMASLLALGPVWAAVFKVAAVVMASWLVWRFKRYRLALQAALLMAAIFCAVLVYHVLGLTVLS
jgi:hypothetical protein